MVKTIHGLNAHSHIDVGLEGATGRQAEKERETQRDRETARKTERDSELQRDRQSMKGDRRINK